MVDRIICCELFSQWISLARSNISSYNANWSGDAHFYGFVYAFVSDKRESILDRILDQSHINFSLIQSQGDGMYVKNTATRDNILIHSSPQMSPLELHYIQNVYLLLLE